MDATAEQFGKIADFHLSHGTTTLLATTIAADMGETLSVLDTFAKYKNARPESTLYGVHLEGPWLNPAHTDATFTEMEEALKHGYNVVTPLFIPA